MYPGNQVVEKFQRGKRDGANAFSFFVFIFISLLHFAIEIETEISKIPRRIARSIVSFAKRSYARARVTPTGKSVAMHLDERREFSPIFTGPIQLTSLAPESFGIRRLSFFFFFSFTFLFLSVY